jgi:hypothetical protein
MLVAWKESTITTDRIHAKHSEHNKTKTVDELKDIYLNILGHHASSVQFHQRTALGRVYLWNLKNLVNLVQEELQDDEISDFDRTNHLNWMNSLTQVEPEIFDVIYTNESQILNGPVIDSKPTSEKRTLEKLTSTKNYLEWLKDAYYQDIFDEKFDDENDVVAPTSLLYLLLRHSILLSYENSSTTLAKEQNVSIQYNIETHDAITRSIKDSNEFEGFEAVIKQQEKNKFRIQFEQEARESLSIQDFESQEEYENEISNFVSNREEQNETILNQNVQELKFQYQNEETRLHLRLSHSDIEI